MCRSFSSTHVTASAGWDLPSVARGAVFAGFARIAIVIALATLAAACNSNSTDTQGVSGDSAPNVVVILIDDLGWRDAAVLGSTFYETPHIDRLAESGIRFTQFYAASPVCSPTRASLMTGKHPARLHITNWIGGEQKGLLLQAPYERQLPLREVTVGEAFREAGYRTGYIGKWHLGKAGFLPDSQGFDYMHAVNEAGQPGSYFAPYENPNWPVTNVPDLETDTTGSYLTDRLTDDAVSFIEANRDASFMLVLSHYAVHTPIQAKASHVAKYTNKVPRQHEFIVDAGTSMTKVQQDDPTYAGMVASMDESVGRVLDTLEALHLDDRTIVVFVSDNGGLSTLARNHERAPTSNLPLRAGKGWLYEGGIRVPLVISWPGRIPASAIDDNPGTTTDVFPTLLNLAGLELRPDQHVDGRVLVDLPESRRPSAQPGDTLYWYFPHYHGSGNVPSGAVRAGDYKLIQWMEDGTVELYDVRADAGETNDLASIEPEKANELEQALARWQEQVGAHLPTPNRDWGRMSDE